MASEPAYELVWGRHRLILGPRTLVMGILNVTPDSFSDGGRYLAATAAVDHARQMVADGADIIDVGGESTRPFSDAVPLGEELDRVIPVIEALAREVSVPISIDTTKAAVARAALAAGASIINDVSALRFDQGMAAVAAESDATLILMHMQGRPKDMQVEPVYGDVVQDVVQFLQETIDFAGRHGVPRQRIIADPGIGFGKTFAHNFRILQQLRAFEVLGVPILVGPSHKAFIRNALKAPGHEALSPDHPRVEIGTQAAVAVAALNGAHILRCHDVAQTKATLTIIDSIRQAA